MKILLPKTLAEPLTIPWFRIKPDAAVTDIMMAIQEYLDYLKDKGWTNSYSDGTAARDQDLGYGARDRLKRSLRIRTRNAGAVDVTVGCIKHPDEEGYTFFVYFKTHEGGPKHMKNFSIVRVD